MSEPEAIERFRCFGCDCGVYVIGDAPEASAAQAAAAARRRLLELDRQFSRFRNDSELSRLNADERTEVPVSPLMARLAVAVKMAGALTGGLVDATLLRELCDAGYGGDLEGPALPLELALALGPARTPAGGSPRRGWSRLQVDLQRGVLRRPPGVLLDSGGIAKGLLADVLGEQLAEHASYAIDCGGDVALGGAAGLKRPIEVRSPFDESVIHTFSAASVGVATSGIGRRSWLGADGRAAHHLLDPRSGRPAFTGVVQASALAPNALLAEIHAKAAVLSGPERGARWLPWGGVLVFDDATQLVVEPGASARSPQAAPLPVSG